MRFIKVLILYAVLFLPVSGYAQQSLLSLGAWNISALSGELKVGGLYGAGEIHTYNIRNDYVTSNYYGGFMVKSSSFIWNPNFLVIDIDGGYYPESRQDLYLVSPNVYNAINTEKLHLGATFFPKKMVTLSTYLNFDNSYDSRENLSDIRTNSKGYGGTFSFRNKFLPLTVTYNESNWVSKELLDTSRAREFSYEQKNLEARVYKSFGTQDKNELIYTHHDYLRRDYNLYSIRNISDNLELQNGLFLDSARNSRFNSVIFGTVQKGNDSFKQFRVSENVYFKLPHHMTWNNNYGFYYIERVPEILQQHSFTSMLGHQLFESFHSSLFYEYNNALETSYHEFSNKVGIDLSYTKKTFADGQISIQFNYSKMRQNRTSSDLMLQIMNEEYTLSDNKVVMIKRPYVDIASVVVKDATGTIIYQPYFDYILVARNNFIEILRVPGGQIPDNSNVFLFYTATQPGSFRYDIDLEYLYVNWSMFNNLLSVYFKSNRNDFSNIHNADNLLLNYLTENVYGIGFKYKAANAGVEYDDYQSSIVPYKMMRYYFMWQGNFRQNLVYSLNVNWRDYKIPTEDEDRIYKDVNAMVAYSFNRKTRVDLTVGYQSQRGRQINLDLFTSRLKVTTIYRKLFFVAGFDMYDRVYLENQRMTYMGAYIQVIKKFKY